MLPFIQNYCPIFLGRNSQDTLKVSCQNTNEKIYQSNHPIYFIKLECVSVCPSTKIITENIRWLRLAPKASKVIIGPIGQ